LRSALASRLCHKKDYAGLTAAVNARNIANHRDVTASLKYRR